MNRKIGVILSYITMLFEVLSTLLLTPFILRTLGQAEYGVYKLAAAIVSYLLLLDLGVGNAVTRYIAKYRAQNDELQSRRFLGIANSFYGGIAILSTIIGVILIIIFPTVFAKGLSIEETKLAQKLLTITVLNTAVTLATAAYNNVIIAYEKFAFSKGWSIIQIVCRIFLTYIVLKMNMGSIGIVLVHFLLTIFCRGIYVYYVRFKLKLKPYFHGIKFDFVKEVVVYSSFILLQMIATQINAFADQILLGMFIPSAATIIAVYGVGAQIVGYFQSIGSSVTGVLMPGVVNMIEKKATPEQICNEMVRIGRMIFMFLVLIWSGFILYGKQFVILWAGYDNYEAYYVAGILMFAHMFILTEGIGTQILWAMNEHREQAMLKMAIVILNIVLTVFLIQWKPMLGATIGTFISLMLGDVGVMNIVFKKKIGIRLKNYYSGLFYGIIPSIVITSIFGLIFYVWELNGWFGLLCKIIGLIGVYTICMWKIEFTQYEKNLVRSLINKIR